MQALLPKPETAKPVMARRSVVLMFTATGAKLYEVKGNQLIEITGRRA